MDVGLDGKPRGRQDPACRGHVVPWEAEPVSEAQPALNAAIALPLAVVIYDALAPDPPELRIVHAREHAGILHRDHGLVVITVQRPGTHLVTDEPATVEQIMERVEVVVTPGADVAQSRLELVRAQDPVGDAVGAVS